MLRMDLRSVRFGVGAIGLRVEVAETVAKRESATPAGVAGWVQEFPQAWPLRGAPTRRIAQSPIRRMRQG
jgi:hypothetical protein